MTELAGGLMGRIGEALAPLFANGAAADLVIALLVAEAIVLLAYARRTGGGLPPLEVLTGVGAGVALVLGLRAALVDAGWQAICLPLAAGGILHAVDLSLRLRRQATLTGPATASVAHETSPGRAESDRMGVHTARMVAKSASAVPPRD
jgi:hypothetical protein